MASLGTSLTDQQARLLAKYADEAVIAYDSDGAGRSAAERAIELLEKTSLKVKLIDLPGAKDPDEYIKKFGADAFRLRLDRSENQVEYKLELVKRKYDLSIDEQRIAYLKEAAQVLSKIDNPVERAVYLARVAETGKIDRRFWNRRQSSYKYIGQKRAKEAAAKDTETDACSTAESQRASLQKRPLSCSRRGIAVIDTE